MNKNIILDQCILFIKSAEFKSEIKAIIKPIIEYLFKDIYIYFFFFVFFILSSFLLHLGILILLIRYNKKLNNFK